MPAFDWGRLHDGERPRITDLLPTHRELLGRHERRLVELTRIAQDQHLDLEDLAFIIADASGMFGVNCIEAEAGWEFLVTLKQGVGVMVIPMDVTGLLELLAALIPEGLLPVTTRMRGQVPILLTDADDEPAVVLLPAHRVRSRLKPA